MSTASKPSRKSWASKTKVSAYDNVAGLIVALVFLIGFAVVLMFLVWLTSVFEFKQRAVPVEYIESLAGRGEAAAGVASDIEEPGMEELADVAEPQLSDTLEAVSDVVSSQAAAMESFEGNAALMGTGSGGGDSRAAGPGGDGDDDVIPRWERWQIKFITSSEAKYAEQLDHFGIELGLVGGGRPEVEYAWNLGKGKPDKRVAGSGKGEQRLRFNYTSGEMRQMDLGMLRKAGFATPKGREPLQFFPPPTEAVLAALENQQAGGRHVREILKTTFGVRGQKGAYEFFVIDQEYRSAPKR